MELISVIIPAYNRGYCIKDAILSVLNQTYKNLEVILIDDGSDDNTESVVDTIHDSRIRYYKNSENMGPSAARNRGVQLARAGYIAFHDSDDLWKPEKLQLQMQIMKNECDLVFCRYEYWMDGELKYVPALGNPNMEDRLQEVLLKGNVIGTPTILMKKELFVDIGGFRENLYSYEDWEFAVRAVKNGKIKFLEASMVSVSYTEGGVNDIEIHAKGQAETILMILEESKRYFFNECQNWEPVMKKILITRWTYLQRQEQAELMQKLGKILQIPAYMLEQYRRTLYNSERNLFNLKMMEKLCDAKAARERLSHCLQMRGIHHIAIYGFGIVGKRLMDIMLHGSEISEALEVTIDYLIDRDVKKESSIKIYTADLIPSVPDAVILTIYDPGGLKKQIEEKIGTAIITVDSIWK